MVKSQSYLVDYHNAEIAYVDLELRSPRYPATPSDWHQRLDPVGVEFYWEMPPILSLCTSYVIHTTPYTSVYWGVLVTERVLLFVVEWIRQIYCQYRMYKVLELIATQIGVVKSDLRTVLGNDRNVSDVVRRYVRPQAWIYRNRERYNQKRPVVYVHLSYVLSISNFICIFYHNFVLNIDKIPPFHVRLSDALPNTFY